jgi:uncharacterized membrane protein
LANGSTEGNGIRKSEGVARRFETAYIWGIYIYIIYIYIYIKYINSTELSTSVNSSGTVQTWTGPDGHSMLRLRDFKKVRT